MKRLKLLTVIVDRDIVDKVGEDVAKLGANFCHVCYGKGTANNELLDLLGLGESEKGILFASVNEDDINAIYSMLKLTHNFNNPGSGIAFTIPMSSVGGPATLKLLQG